MSMELGFTHYLSLEYVLSGQLLCGTDEGLVVKWGWVMWRKHKWIIPVFLVAQIATRRHIHAAVSSPG